METTNCQRCGKLCRKGTPDPEARPFRKAMAGFCLECCVAYMFQVETPDNVALPMAYKMALVGGFKPADLMLPHLQAQFKRLLEVGQSQGKYEEIDWPTLIEKWDMPFSTKAPKKKAPKGQEPLWS